LERWESAYRQSELCELLPKYNGGLGRKGQWSKPAKELFYHLYFGPEKRQVATCYYIMRGKAIENDWQIPSLRSVQRHVQGAPEDVKTLYREGRQAFRGKAEPKIRRAFDGIPSGEHIEGDERTCDFYVRVPSAKGWKRIRPIITAWLDRRSRIIFGWWLDARGNSDTILASFKRGVLDYGRPKELTIDNGEDYKSVAGNPRKGSRWSEFDDKRLRHCFSELDIKVHLTLPYTPWSKGQIESFFSTMAERFDKFMESYCGNKPENRPEGANRVLVEKLPTLEEARSRFGDFVNAYHQHPHTGDGMNGLCPAQAHEQYLAGVAPVTPETLDYLCAKRIGPKRVGQNGIQHHHVVFGQRQGEVWKLRGRKVWLRVLPDVADRVWVETEDGKPICVAQAETIRGATQDDIRTAAKLRKDRKKAARTYFEDVVPKRHARPIDDIHEAQRIAASADRIDAPEPPTPMTVRLTRPDIDAALARRNDSGVGGEYDSAVAGEILHMPSFELPEDEEVIETGNAFARSFEDAGEEILEGPDEAGQRLRTLADAG
jgi:transposase InsO family protein